MVSSSYQSKQHKTSYHPVKKPAKITGTSYFSQRKLRAGISSYQPQRRLYPKVYPKAYQPQRKPKINIVGISAYPKKKQKNIPVSRTYIRKAEKEQLIINKERQKEIKKLLKTLSIGEKNYIKEQVKNRESDYGIVKQFDDLQKEVVLREIRKYKNQEKKEVLRSVNKKSKELLGYSCGFNYITQHHIGYQFTQKCNYIIYVGIPINELKAIIHDISNILKILHEKVKCLQRVNYCSLEYVLYLNNGEKDESKKSTNINGKFGLASFKDMLNQIQDVIYWVYDIVHQAQSSKQIQIYNVIYVNYDFKNNVMR